MTSEPDDAVLAKLKKGRVARLATVDSRRRPHIVPICFAWDGKFLYTALDQKPKRLAPERLARIRHIRTNPSVAVLVDEYREDWSRLWYVMLRGRATVLSAAASPERAKAVKLLRAKYRRYAGGMLADDAMVIRILPKRITAWGKFR